MLMMMVIYSSSSTLDLARSHLQSDCDAVQHTLSDLKLLNAEKSLIKLTKRSMRIQTMLSYYSSGFGD